MRYRPVYICQVFRYHIRDERKVQTFYQASSRSVGNCGHKHRSETACEPCLRKLQKLWSKWRSEKCQQAWGVRKLNQQTKVLTDLTQRINTPVVQR